MGVGIHDEIVGALVPGERLVLLAGAGSDLHDEIEDAPFPRARLGGVCSLVRVVVVALEALALGPWSGLPCCEMLAAVLVVVLVVVVVVVVVVVL